ncbi:MAG: hypothetical protein ACK5MN_13945 [Lachnospiraceae bacterium]
MRGTNHSSRKKGNAEHNDKTYGKRKNADPARTPYNVQWCVYPDMGFKEAELRFYDENFRGQIDATNRKAVKSRHKERITSPEKLLEQESTRPEEVIYQIGNKDQHVSAAELQSVYEDFSIWHDEKHGDHVKTLNWALHVDENTPHIQRRQVWTYHHEDGYEAIGQHKALEQMGYTLPDPDRKRDRYNNLKVVYTAECRQKWIDICREHGIEIESEPKHRAPNKQNLDKGDYVIMMQDQKIAAQQRKAAFITKEMNDQIAAGDIELQKRSEALRRLDNEFNDKMSALKDLNAKKAFITTWIKEQLPEYITMLNQTRQQMEDVGVLDMARQYLEQIKEHNKTIYEDVIKYGTEGLDDNFKDITDAISSIEEDEDWDDKLRGR